MVSKAIPRSSTPARRRTRRSYFRFCPTFGSSGSSRSSTRGAMAGSVRGGGWEGLRALVLQSVQEVLRRRLVGQGEVDPLPRPPRRGRSPPAPARMGSREVVSVSTATRPASRISSTSLRHLRDRSRPGTPPRPRPGLRVPPRESVKRSMRVRNSSSTKSFRSRSRSGSWTQPLQVQLHREVGHDGDQPLESRTCSACSCSAPGPASPRSRPARSSRPPGSRTPPGASPPSWARSPGPRDVVGAVPDEGQVVHHLGRRDPEPLPALVSSTHSAATPVGPPRPGFRRCTPGPHQLVEVLVPRDDDRLHPRLRRPSGPGSR
jgi:hypothetical protein